MEMLFFDPSQLPRARRIVNAVYLAAGWVLVFVAALIAANAPSADTLVRAVGRSAMHGCLVLLAVMMICKLVGRSLRPRAIILGLLAWTLLLTLARLLIWS